MPEAGTQREYEKWGQRGRERMQENKGGREVGTEESARSWNRESVKSGDREEEKE